MRLTLLLKGLDLARHCPGHDFHQARRDLRMQLHEAQLTTYKIVILLLLQE